MIKIFVLVFVCLITYDTIPFVLKYIRIRKEGNKTKAQIISIKHATKGRAGLVPLLNYQINDKDFKGITPLYSSFTSSIYGAEIREGKEIEIFYNSKQPDECIILNDKNVLVQILFFLLVYVLFIFVILNVIKLN